MWKGYVKPERIMKNLRPTSKKFQPIKIGFDFDGVIMYNPLRIIRPFMSFLKIKRLVKRQQLVFFHPQTNWQKVVWWLAHQTSFIPAPGINKLKSLVKSGKIEAYLITGRSSFLKSDLHRKLKIFGLDKVFSKVIITDSNEQPHIFKERMINLHKLEYFIEDNWDIISHLANKYEQNRLFWIYNMVDKSINYPQKHPNLLSAINEILRKEAVK